jgi:ribosomal-protein-serine acetyltransferase
MQFMCNILHITPYLQLHPASVKDAGEMFALIDSNRHYLRRWLPFVDLTQEENDSVLFLSAVAAEDQMEKNPVYIIRFHGELAGLVGFKDTDQDNLRTEIGYWLAERFQHRGIMTSSVRTLINFAFEELRLNRIQIRCAVGNNASKQIPRRLGFRLEGVERDGELLSDGVFTDLEVYSLIRRKRK